MIEELFEKELLKRTKKSVELAKKSLNQARFFLDESIDLVELNKKRMAIIALYNAFFHTARAFLFKDGIKEKSHYALARYLEFEYIDKGEIDRKFLLALDFLRDLRHESQYSVSLMEIEIEFEEYFDICKEFIRDTEKKLFK